MTLADGYSYTDTTDSQLYGSVSDFGGVAAGSPDGESTYEELPYTRSRYLLIFFVVFC